LKGVFDKSRFAESSSGHSGDTVNDYPCADGVSASESSKSEFIRADGLHSALHELGVSMERAKVEELMVLMDLDGNGCLDFEEFKRAVQQQPTQLEQWTSMLPLSGMLAKSLPVSGGLGDQPLRDFSRLSEDEINTAADVFSDGLRRLLMEAKSDLRQMFDCVDKKASEAAKDSAGGVSAVSKFKTFKMNTGVVADYHEGLSSRIGALTYAFIHCRCKYLPALLWIVLKDLSLYAVFQERRIPIFLRASEMSTASCGGPPKSSRPATTG
jgi:hypothetical protein